MDDGRLMPYLDAFVDDQMRIDGAYALVKLPGDRVPLHAQSVSPREGTGWYHVHHGAITSGLTGVEWALTDQPDGCGGFCVVPGSHKANFELPLGELTEHAQFLPVQAGDVILFTEALTHGSHWHGPGSRRVLIYKYCPHNTAWSSYLWTDQARAGFTERQRRMTLPPYEFDMRRNADRDPTDPR
jgi:hypothetical protein